MLLFSPNTLVFQTLSKNWKIKIYKTIVLPVMLYGCETWCLILRKKCWLSIFENRNPRRIFKSKTDENGKWRKLHNEDIRSLYHSPNTLRVIKTRRLRWVGHVARMEETYRRERERERERDVQENQMEYQQCFRESMFCHA